MVDGLREWTDGVFAEVSEESFAERPVDGVVEGFVTPRDWPWQIKIAIGALALGVFLFYMLVVGRRAARAGETGDLTEYEAGTPTLTAG